MQRSRRIAATVVAATGILGGAGVAVAATGVGHPSEPAQPDAPSAAAAVTVDSSPVVSADDPGEGQRQALADYVATMSRRGDTLAQRVAKAKARLARVEAARAAQAAAAASATAPTATRRSTLPAVTHPGPPAVQPGAPAPATHTSTGASGATGGGHGDDTGEHEHEHESGQDD